MKVPCVLLVYWAVCLWENLIRLSMSMLLQWVYLFVKWFVCLCKCCCYGSIYAYFAAMGLSMHVRLKYVCLSSIDGVTYVWVCCVTLICLCMYLCECVWNVRLGVCTLCCVCTYVFVYAPMCVWLYVRFWFMYV